MKSLKNVFCVTLLILFSQYLTAQTALCNSIFNFLKAEKCNPKTQSLVSSSVNYFPYNLSVDFDAKNTSSDNYFYTPKNLFLIFNQEDFFNNKEIFSDIFNFIKKANFDFNIKILFVYGENQKIMKDGIVYGLDNFLSSVNTNEDSTAIIINLDREQSSIISTSSGFSAPSWLIKNEHDIFSKAKIHHGLPFYYISQMYSFKFSSNHQLDSFFSYKIPAIALNFSSKLNNTKLLSTLIIDSIYSFSKTSDTIWDQHFMMINFFGQYIRISEEKIVKIIIIIILLSIIFIALLGFINSSLQKEAWNKIKTIWYVAPISFILIIISQLCGKGIFLLFEKKFSQAGKLYFYSGASLITAFLLTTCYYWIQILKNSKYESKSVDFIIVITIFINQFIFSFYDISLFPIFMFICLLSIIGLIFKNNILHICLLAVTIIPIALYTHTLINISNTQELFEYINNNYLSVSFVLYPLFLMYFRILTRFREAFTKKVLFIMGGITISCALIGIISIGIVRKNVVNHNITVQAKTISLVNEQEDLIQIAYKDSEVFDDTIRKLSITFDRPCYQCEVLIRTENASPILYSQDDYELLDNNTASFRIPNNPPQNLTFNYALNNVKSIVKINAYFETNDKDKFSLLSKSITIKE